MYTCSTLESLLQIVSTKIIQVVETFVHYNQVHNTPREGQYKIGATKKADMKSTAPKNLYVNCMCFMFGFK